MCYVVPFIRIRTTLPVTALLIYIPSEGHVQRPNVTSMDTGAHILFGALTCVSLH